jgi:hypothetical protein
LARPPLRPIVIPAKAGIFFLRRASQAFVQLGCPMKNHFYLKFQKFFAPLFFKKAAAAF